MGTTRQAELSLYMQKHKPSLIVLQEPMHHHLHSKRIPDTTTYIPYTPKPLPYFQEYTPIHFAHHNRNTGILMYVHKSCTFHPLKHIPHSTPYCIDRRKGTVAGFVWISSPLLPTPIVVGGVYLHASCQEIDIATLAKSTATAAAGPLRSFPSPVLFSPPSLLPVFLVGDFNARHMSWDKQLKKEDSCGTWLVDHLISRAAQIYTPTLPRITLLNTHFTKTRFAPTHINADDDTVIDLALTSHPDMIKSMRVMTEGGDTIGSDHYPLELIFNITQAQIAAQHTTQTQIREQARTRLFGGAAPIVPAPAVPVPSVLPVPPVPPVPLAPLPYVIRASPGRGLGLFAATHFKKGSLVVQYTGDIIDEATKQLKYPDESTRGKYLIRCKQNMYIDACNPATSSAGRYINTANEREKNNVRFKISFRDGRPTVNVRAIGKIAPGTEFLVPYGRGYFFEDDENDDDDNNNNNNDNINSTHVQAGAMCEGSDRIDDDDAFIAQLLNGLDEKELEPNPGIAVPVPAPVHPDHVLVPPPPRPLNFSFYGKLHTDGASRGNPGIASCGGVLSYDHDTAFPNRSSMSRSLRLLHKLVEFGAYLGITTNNHAEYQGLIRGLTYARQFGITHLKVYLDSDLIVKQMNGIYRASNRFLYDMYKECKELSAGFQSCSFTHVPRAENKEADKLCNDVLKKVERQGNTNGYYHEIDHDTIPTAALTPPANAIDILAQAEQERKEKEATDEDEKDDDTDDDDADDDPPDTTERVRWNVSNSSHPVDWSAYADEVKQELIPWMRKNTVWAEQHTPQQITREQLNVCWNELLSVMVRSADKHVGISKVREGSKQWWSHAPNVHALHKAYRSARHLVRKNRKRDSTVPIDVRVRDKAAYSKAKGEFNKVVRKARRECWNSLIASVDGLTADHKHKLLWSKSKRLMKTGKNAKGSFCDEHGMPPETETQSLDNMAVHLANVSSLAPTSAPDAQQLEREVQEYISSDQHVPLRPDRRTDPPFTLDKVKLACSSLRLNTSLGSDNVSPYFLKHGGDALHRAINVMFKICYRHGMMPDTWKHGHVVTIYKGEGDVNDASSYRPITITSVVARAYERVNAPELIEKMMANGIPSLDQFGFTRHRSTHDALYRLLSRVHEAIDGGTGDNKFCPAVFIDISKAYDKVWIEGLLYKLHHDMGITGNLFYMLRDLLMDRTIQVVADGKMSIRLVLRAGVPQGSILAPFLFLIYIHDIISRNADVDHELAAVIASLFADDIAVLAPVAGRPGIAVLQRCLDAISKYARRWKMSFSAKKTNVVFFRRRTKFTNPAPRVGQFELGGFAVKPATQYKYLGVVLDEFLSFRPHVQAMYADVMRTVYMITRLVRRDHLPSIPVIRTLVKNVLVPKLTYSFPFLPDATALCIPTTREIAAEGRKRKQQEQERKRNKYKSNRTVNRTTTTHTRTRARTQTRAGHVHVPRVVDGDEMERKYDHDYDADVETHDERDEKMDAEEEKRIDIRRQARTARAQAADELLEEKNMAAPTRKRNRYTKNLILRPLIHGMGLPHNAHHESIFIENRMLNANMLLSVSKAGLAHRWLALGADSSNLAATMFRSHLSRFRSLSSSHPCRIIIDSIKKVPAFKFMATRPSVFESLSRSTLKTLAWEQQYNTWKETLTTKNTPHTLPPQYTPEPVSVKELPPYMHHDRPMASARRSRLRLGRAQLNASRNRLGYKDQLHSWCDHCLEKRSVHVYETVSHVLAMCPLYEGARLVLTTSLSKLRLSSAADSYISEVGIDRVVLTPERIPQISKSNLRKVHRRTAKYINAVYNTRPKHY